MMQMEDRRRPKSTLPLQLGALFWFCFINTTLPFTPACCGRGGGGMLGLWSVCVCVCVWCSCVGVSWGPGCGVACLLAASCSYLNQPHKQDQNQRTKPSLIYHGADSDCNFPWAESHSSHVTVDFPIDLHCRFSKASEAREKGKGKEIKKLKLRSVCVETPTEMKARQMPVAFLSFRLSVSYCGPFITVGFSFTGPSPYPHSPFPFPVACWLLSS